MKRRDNRDYNQIRDIKITPDFISKTPGSVLIEQGRTKVLCSATIEYKVPHFIRNEKKGWINAEYSMLPGSTGNRRVQRERMRQNGRNIEIQRFIARALRNTINLKRIEGISINIDCDVLEADGGTRCASLNGGMIVLKKALEYLVFENKIKSLPEIEYIAAVSLGVKDNQILADLTFEEDSKVDADINIISTDKGDIVEVSAFAELKTVKKEVFDEIINIGIDLNKEIINKLMKF